MRRHAAGQRSSHRRPGASESPEKRRVIMCNERRALQSMQSSFPSNLTASQASLDIWQRSDNGVRCFATSREVVMADADKVSSSPSMMASFRTISFRSIAFSSVKSATTVLSLTTERCSSSRCSVTRVGISRAAENLQHGFCKDEAINHPT
jgi:hypothetical protein